MLVVLLKTDYNTRVAEIDTKVSNLNGKIAKNESIVKNLRGANFYYIFLEILCLMVKMVFKLI